MPKPLAVDWQVNPAWLKASHVVLFSYPDAPSFDEQLQADRNAQAKALLSLPKPERRKYRRTHTIAPQCPPRPR